MISKMLLLVCISLVFYTVLLALPLQLSKLKRTVIIIVSFFSSALLLFTQDILTLWQRVMMLSVAILFISYLLANKNKSKVNSSYTISGLATKNLVIQVNKKEEPSLGKVQSEGQPDSFNSYNSIEIKDQNYFDSLSSQEIEEKSASEDIAQEYIISNNDNKESILEEATNSIDSNDLIENIELDNISQEENIDNGNNDINYEEMLVNEHSDYGELIDEVPEESLVEQELAQKVESYDVFNQSEYHPIDEPETLDELFDLDEKTMEEEPQTGEAPEYLHESNNENINENSSIFDLFNEENAVIEKEEEDKKTLKENVKEQNVETVDDLEYHVYSEDEKSEKFTGELLDDLNIDAEIETNHLLSRDQNNHDEKESKEEIEELNFNTIQTVEQFDEETEDDKNNQIADTDNLLTELEDLQTINAFNFDETINEENKEEHQEDTEEIINDTNKEEQPFEFDIFENELTEDDQENGYASEALNNVDLEETQEGDKGDISESDLLQENNGIVENRVQDEEYKDLNIDLLSHFRNEDVEDDLLFKGINSLHNKKSVSLEQLISDLNNHDEEMIKEERLKEENNKSKTGLNKEVFLAPLEDDEEDLEEERNHSHYIRSYANFDGSLMRVPRRDKYKKKKWWKAWK